MHTCVPAMQINCTQLAPLGLQACAEPLCADGKAFDVPANTFVTCRACSPPCHTLPASGSCTIEVCLPASFRCVINLSSINST
jgi:hypothetical protein